MSPDLRSLLTKSETYQDDDASAQREVGWLLIFYALAQLALVALAVGIAARLFDWLGAK